MNGAQDFVWIKARADGLADVGEKLQLFSAAMGLLEKVCIGAMLARIKEKDDAEEHRCQRSQEQRDVLVKFHCTSQTEAATRGTVARCKASLPNEGFWAVEL